MKKLSKFILITLIWAVSFIGAALSDNNIQNPQDLYVRASYADLRNFFLFVDAGSQSPTRVYLKEGYSVEFCIGKSLGGNIDNNPIVDLEIMANYQHREAHDKAREYDYLKTYAGMLNANVRLFEWKDITPYLGIGAGFANNDLKSSFTRINKLDNEVIKIEDNSSLSFAWQWRIGGIYRFNKKFSAEIFYCNMHVGNVRSQFLISQSINSAGVRAGLRYNL